MWKLWKYIFSILTVAVTTEVTISVNGKDIIDTIAGGTFIIRTWPNSVITLYVTIAKDNITLMHGSFQGSLKNTVDNAKDHLELKYNDTTKEISLLICNISRRDEGIYHIDESTYEIPKDPFERQIGKWSFQLNVFDPDEIKTSSVGENTTIMEFQRSDIFYPLLYYYDRLVATLHYSECNVMNTTHLFGRLKCTSNNNTKTYRIEIQNVTQMDTGLYRVMYNENNDTERCFTNITENPIHAIVGDYVTIGWYYNQQEMNGTLRIIHPNDGVMMILRPSNNSTTRSTFQNRALYNGDISRSYMSFTLCNLSKSDTGFYRIETQHGNRIPGGKQLIVEVKIVEDNIITSTRNIATIHTLYTEIPANSSYGQSSSLQPVPIYVISVATGVGALIILVIGCLMWNQRKTSIVPSYTIEQFEIALFETPSSIRNPPLVPPTQERMTGLSIPSAILSLPISAFPSTSASIDAACNIIYSLKEPNDDTPRLGHIANYHETSERSNVKESFGYAEDIDYDILDSYPSIGTLASAKGAVEHTYNCIADGYAHRQALYAKVNKEPKPSSDTGAIVCKHEYYELVDVSRSIGPTKTDNADDTAPESARNRIQFNLGTLSPRNAFIHGTKKDVKCATNKTVSNVRSVESVKVCEDGEAIPMRDEEPTKQELSTGVDNNHYADIVL